MRLLTLLMASVLGIATVSVLAAEPVASQPADAKKAAAPAVMRLAVVGLVHGHVPQVFHEMPKRNDIKLVGICETNTTLAHHYIDHHKLDRKLLYSDVENMLTETKPQGVLIFTHTKDHRRVVEICAKHKIDVMMEKPMAVSMKDAKAIQQAAKEHNIQVMVNYETTWYRSNTAVYEMFQKKTFGDITKIVVHDGHRGPQEIGVGAEFLEWLIDPELNGAGALFDFGCYGANLSTWLHNNQRPLSVTAIALQSKPDIYARVDDDSTIILTYPKSQAIIQGSWNWPYSRKDLEVYGQTGAAITIRRDEVRVIGREETDVKVIQAKPLAPPYNNYFSYFRAVVLKEIKPGGPSTLENGMIVTEILVAAKKSAETGQTVKLSTEREKLSADK